MTTSHSYSTTFAPDQAASSSASSSTFRVLSLNVWGLKFVAAHRRARIHAIAEFLAQSSSVRGSQSFSADNSSGSSAGSGSGLLKSRRKTEERSGDDGYDVVCLQEVWCQEDVDLIRERAKEGGLVHCKHFLSGAIGGGLVILSRHQILSTSLHPYRLNGHALHVIEGDFFVGKAVGGIKIRLEDGSLVEVFNTHFFAPGGEGPDEWRRAHRLSQVWQLSQIVREAAERGSIVIVCGDLNSVPSSLCIRLLLSLASLIDVWPVLRPPPHSYANVSAHDRTSSPHIDMYPAPHGLSAQDCIHMLGITCDSPLNTYSAGKTLDRHARADHGKRLDYVLFRPAGNSLPGGGGESKVVPVPVQASVELTDPVPDQPFSYSDHFGLSCTFSLTSSTSSPPLPSPIPLTSSLLSQLSTALSLHLHHTLQTRTLHLRLFGLSLVLIPALAIAASFQPLGWLSWLFVLASVATGAGGATMLFVGFVGGGWEARALKDFREEVERSRGQVEEDERNCAGRR